VRRTLHLAVTRQTRERPGASVTDQGMAFGSLDDGSSAADPGPGHEPNNRIIRPTGLGRGTAELIAPGLFRRLTDRLSGHPGGRSSRSAFGDPRSARRRAGSGARRTNGRRNVRRGGPWTGFGRRAPKTDGLASLLRSFGRRTPEAAGLTRPSSPDARGREPHAAPLAGRPRPRGLMQPRWFGHRVAERTAQARARPGRAGPGNREGSGGSAAP
jgi:hypothetical protein